MSGTEKHVVHFPEDMDRVFASTGMPICLAQDLTHQKPERPG